MVDCAPESSNPVKSSLAIFISTNGRLSPALETIDATFIV